MRVLASFLLIAWPWSKQKVPPLERTSVRSSGYALHPQLFILAAKITSTVACVSSSNTTVPSTDCFRLWPSPSSYYPFQPTSPTHLLPPLCLFHDLAVFFVLPGLTVIKNIQTKRLFFLSSWYFS